MESAHPAPASVDRPLRAWALPLLAGLATLAAMWAGRDFLIPLVTSIVLAVLLWPGMRLLERWLRLRVAVALAAVMGTLVCAGALAFAVGTQLSGAADELPSVLRLVARDIGSLGTAPAKAMQRTRSALAELDRSVARVTGTERSLTARSDGAGPSSIVAVLADGASKLAIAASKSLAGVLLQTGAIALLTFFMLCSGEALAARLTQWCRAGVAGPERCQPLLAEAARQIRLFAGVTVVTNLAIGLGVALVFALFGVPDAGMWGVTAAALHFVPYAGLAAMMALAALEVYVAQSTLLAALLAAGMVAAIGVVVGTAMAVWLQGRVAKVDSATLFAGTIFWSVLWGGWGLVLGPLLVVVSRLAFGEARRLVKRPAPVEPPSPAP